MLQNGQLSPFLLPPHIVRSKMIEVINHVRNTVPHYKMIYKTTTEVYRNARFVFLHVAGHLLITVDFPLRLDDHEKFDVYKILLIPMAVPHQPRATMHLKTSIAGLAIAKDQTAYYYLDDKEILEIQIKATHSFRRRVFRIPRHGECMLAIFRDDIHQIKESCNYTITLNNLQREILWLGEDLFLATAIPDHQVKCLHVPTQNRPGCDLCFIRTEPSCRVLADDWLVPGEWRRGGHDNVSIQFSLNRPFAIHFLPNETMNKLSGETWFPSRPHVERFIPQLKIHEAETQRLLAEDKRIQLQMSRTVDSLKRDAIVYSDLSASIADGLETLPTKWEWDTYLNFATTGLTIVLTVVMVGLLLRIRGLALTIAIIEQNITQVDGAADLDLFKPEPTKPRQIPHSDQNTNTWQNQYDAVISAINYHETLILIGAMVFIILMFVIYRRICRCVKTIQSMHIKSDLVLRFTNGYSDINIKIQQFSGLLENLRIHGDASVGDIRVTGTIFPRLKFVWYAQVEDTFTRKTWHVTNNVNVTFLEAYIVRKFLGETFEIVPLFISKGVVTTCKFIIPDTTPVAETDIAAAELAEFREYKIRYEREKANRLHRSTSVGTLQKKTSRAGPNPIEVRRFSITPGMENE